MLRFLLPALCLSIPLLGPPLRAIEIRIDYRLDTNNFFDTNEKRAVLEEVADFFGSILRDNLLRIDPADFSQASWTALVRNPQTGNTEQIANLTVPENTLIIFVGARELGGTVRGEGGPGGYSASGFPDWFSRLRARGNPGADFGNAEADQRTDFAPWGGSIAFDTTTDFNFSAQRRQAGIDFISVALHEIAHVLGIGLVDSWHNRIQGGVFTGTAVNRSAGFEPPVTSTGGHFDGDTLTSPSFGSFDRAHGSTGLVLMLSSSTSRDAALNVASDLDLAALADIGWEVVPPADLTVTSLGPASASFTWPSSSFIDYRLERGTDLAAFNDVSGEIPGNAQVQAWIDPAPLAGRAFYRLRSTPAPGSVATGAAPPLTGKSTGNSPAVPSTITVDPLTATDCFCTSH